MISSNLKKGNKATNQLVINGSPTQTVCNKKSNCHDEQGIRYPKSPSFDGPSWRSSLAFCISLGGNNISKSTLKRYNLLLFLLEHKLNNNVNPNSAPSCMRQFCYWEGKFPAWKGISQPIPPLQGMLQLQGPVAINRPPEKFYQDQT